MHKHMFFAILYLLINCSPSGSKTDVAENFGLFFGRSLRVSVSGTAVKGIVKNARAVITTLKTDGSCDSEKVLGSALTDSSGNYSLVYAKTGSTVCLTVSDNPDRTAVIFDEKSGKDLSLSSQPDFKMVTILPESRIVENSRKNTIASPFSHLIAKRLQFLAKQSGGSTDLNKLYQKASKEVVIRFGLHTGLSGSGKADSVSSAKISDSDYPELDDLKIDLQDSSSPLGAKFISILGGISYLANKHKKGSTVSAEDVNSVLKAFASDFEDGVFDGKGSDGTAVSIGSGASQTAFSSTPLTTLLLPAIISYFQEGGTLSLSGVNSSASTLTAQQVSVQLQFVDNTPIISSFSTGTSPPASLIYAGSPYSFLMNAPVTAVVPTFTGTVTGCTVSPSLPTGLSLNSITCAISGTPTLWQAGANYTVTASNSFGTTSAAVNISVTSDAVSWTARTLPSSSNWYSVTYGNGVFATVAGGVGATTIAASSTDGMNWTARTLPTSSVWTSVTYGNGIFAAVAKGPSTAAASSTDGINWTSRTLPSSQDWISVTYGNGRFVAVSVGNTASAYSTDGITWNAGGALPSASAWAAVAYGNGMFAAVASGPSTIAASSPDGITWTARTLPTNSGWFSMAFGNGVFVANASGPSNASAYSADGINWTASTLPSSQSWSATSFGNGVFFAVATSSNVGATSFNGISWTARTMPSSTNWYSVAYGLGRFAAIALTSNIAASSP